MANEIAQWIALVGLAALVGACLLRVSALMTGHSGIGVSPVYGPAPGESAKEILMAFTNHSAGRAGSLIVWTIEGCSSCSDLLNELKSIPTAQSQHLSLGLVVAGSPSYRTDLGAEFPESEIVDRNSFAGSSIHRAPAPLYQHIDEDGIARHEQVGFEPGCIERLYASAARA